MSLLPVSDALALILNDVVPLGGEPVPLHDAAGRVLAAPVTALRTQPPFAASAMDGYALRSSDIAASPARLNIVGEAMAGRRYAGSVGAGEAVRIFTGAPVPQGADAIVIQENARRIDDDASIEVSTPVEPGQHIRRRGLDFREGDLLLERGRILDGGALSLAAAANHSSLDVVKRPLAAIFATGDELLPPGSSPGPDQIISSNAYGVSALVQSAGGRSLDLGIAPDRRDMIARLVGKALDAGAEVIVTLGGASVGDHDLIREVLTGEGMELDFWKIAMRPGKPLMFGRLGHTRVLCLPGNPVASLVCGHLFVKPLLARLGGMSGTPNVRAAVLGGSMDANDEREDYVRASLSQTQGRLTATPFEQQDSSMLRLFAEAGALIIREPHAPAAAAGAPCRVLLLR